MQVADRHVLEEFARRVRALFAEARVWAFGSRARGDATWESDLDVCIVLDRVDRSRDATIREIAWEVGFERGLVLTTVVLDQEQFERGPMSESTLVATILREGVAA